MSHVVNEDNFERVSEAFWDVVVFISYMRKLSNLLGNPTEVEAYLNGIVTSEHQFLLMEFWKEFKRGNLKVLDKNYQYFIDKHEQLFEQNNGDESIHEIRAKSQQLSNLVQDNLSDVI